MSNGAQPRPTWPENALVAARLREMAALLEAQGDNAFRVAAYRNAAQTVDGLPQGLRELRASRSNRRTAPRDDVRVRRGFRHALAPTQRLPASRGCQERRQRAWRAGAGRGARDDRLPTVDWFGRPVLPFLGSPRPKFAARRDSNNSRKRKPAVSRRVANPEPFPRLFPSKQRVAASRPIQGRSPQPVATRR